MEVGGRRWGDPRPPASAGLGLGLGLGVAGSFGDHRLKGLPAEEMLPHQLALLKLWQDDRDVAVRGWLVGFQSTFKRV